MKKTIVATFVALGLIVSTAGSVGAEELAIKDVKPGVTTQAIKDPGTGGVGG